MNEHTVQPPKAATNKRLPERGSSHAMKREVFHANMQIELKSHIRCYKFAQNIISDSNIFATEWHNRFKVPQFMQCEI